MAPDSPITDDDVRQIIQLVETLEKSPFDFLQLEVADMRLTLGKGDPPALSGSGTAVPTAVPTPVPPKEAAPAPAAPAARTDDGTVAVTAPIMGRFYAQSEPSAAPFVTVGSEVSDETTVALLEVMKVFTTVTAGVGGVVTEVCVQNEDVVEYGQVLFRVRPTTDKP